MDEDVEAGWELAWRRFRGRLADRLAELEEDVFLVVSLRSDAPADVVHEDGGVAPYVRFIHWGEQRLRAEAVGNPFRHWAFELTPEQEAALEEIGWEPAELDDRFEPVSGRENFHLFATLRDADRVAALAVETLRRVHGCLHPAFLDADGLEVDGEPAVLGAGPGGERRPEQLAEPVHDRDHLQSLVDDALTVMLGEPVAHDADGDIPITCGLSTAFVRVLEDRPAVEVFAYAVVDVADDDAAAFEADEANRRSADVQWYVDGDRVLARTVVLAQPFVAGHLREAVARFCAQLDDAAEEVARGARGRRFRQEPRPQLPGRASAPPVGQDVVLEHPGLQTLLEILHEGDVAPATVAHLFDGDRRALVREIVRVRTSGLAGGGLGEHVVLRHLRRALRLVADREARVERGRPDGPTTRQLTLLTDEDLGQGTLDTGWGS